MVRKTADPETQVTSRSDQSSLALKFFARFQRFVGDIGGILMLAFAFMTLLALLLPDLTQGALLVWWSEFLWIWLGWGGLWIVVVISMVGLLMLRRTPEGDFIPWEYVRWRQVFTFEALALLSLALLAALGGSSLERADLGLDGGRIGWGLSYVLGLILSPIGFAGTMWRVLILTGLMIFCLIVGFQLTRPMANWIQNKLSAEEIVEESPLVSGQGVSVSPIQGQESSSIQATTQRKKQPRIPLEFRKKFRIPDEQPQLEEKAPMPPRDERLPPLDLLVDEQSSRPDERHINQTAGLIEKTLAEFGISAKVIGFRVGPTVTQFAVEPGYLDKTQNGMERDVNRQKVRVAQISSLSRDLALALSAERLRIQAPVPGRPYIGIEVPNPRSTVVRLRPILETESFYKIGSPLAVALGRDVSGQPVVADLERMPHLLIAGTTGSGKSVCIAALTTCLVMNNSPDELRLIMVDPKMVELVRFNGLPHLYGKVETELERILGVLRWTVAEMDRRYKLLEASRSRNIDTYNRKARRRKNEQVLPRIVVLLDELADLMMSAPEQTEPALIRLAQMARATGIHLVIATQRPSTDVVTGLIKANFPARLSFAVASSIDSRVILDATGAESLLGQGDMLFLPPEASAPLRSQGVMVSDQEVERVITYWQKPYADLQEETPPWEQLLEQEAILADRDGLIEEAIKIVSETQRASASMLQRRLRIGYPRAARLIDELHDMGIVGPPQGGGRERDVLIEGDRDE